jgi:hypothetical protein
MNRRRFLMNQNQLRRQSVADCLPSFLVVKWLLHRADSYPSRSASILQPDSKWANPCPNGVSDKFRIRTRIAARCLWDFTGTIKASQFILLSIFGYSLAWDAKSKDFQIWDLVRWKRVGKNCVTLLKDGSFCGNQAAEHQTCVEIPDQSWMSDDNQPGRQSP